MPSEPRDVLGVAELDRILRRAVEQSTGHVWLEGEVASLRRVASGHVYFVLKDEREDAVIDGVMYRFQAQRASRHLENGRRVQLYGRATVWAPRGRLQFVAESARPAGLGDLLARLEALKAKLAAEGLFDAERKRPIPSEPACVGVVTSRHGAALHDIVTVAHGRGGVRIVLAAATVQGEGAPQSILRALDLIERLGDLDVVIVGRGGGSAEDLMAFNDERVVRRVAACRVPVVSAVGHEIDTSLTDLVADVRAATPSHAAELVVPDRAHRSATLQRALGHLVRVVRSRLVEDRATVLGLRQKIADPRFVIASRQQLVDDYRFRLERTAVRAVKQRRAELSGLDVRLRSRHPRLEVMRARGRLEPLTLRLGTATAERLREARSGLSELGRQLDALSPLAVLSRGYAIAQSEDGRAIRAAEDVSAGDTVSVRVSKGRFLADVREVQKED